MACKLDALLILFTLIHLKQYAWVKNYTKSIFIDHEASEVICLAASIHLSAWPPEDAPVGRKGHPMKHKNSPIYF